MKKNFLKLLVAGSLTFIFGYGIYAYGCADGWWGSGYTSIFSPEITVNNKEYEPFFYDDYTTFYNGNNVQSTTDLFKEESIDDWTAYLEHYDKESVEYYLYNNELNTVLSELASEKDKTAAFNTLVADKYVLNKNDVKTKNLLEFMMLSRGLETYSNQLYHYWDYNNRIALNTEQELVQKIEQVFKKASNKDTFYKNRLWFQVLRAKFYSNDRSSVIPFFNDTERKQPKNNLYYRGLSYVGGAYKSVKNYEKANATFAQVFNQCKPMMPSALFDYKPLDEAGFKASLSQAPNQSVKETMYALQGYYTNEFTALQDLYKLNPNSPHLDFLLSRWVNINEQSINIYTAYEQLDIDAKKVNKELKDKVNAAELKWINEVANGSKVHNPYIWKATAAYFNALVGDYSKADNLLKQAHTLSKNQEQKGQVRSLRLLNNLLSVNQIDLKAEGKLIEDVNWLFYDEANVNYWKSNNRVNYLQTFTKKYISSLYKAEENALMSELTYPIKGFFKDQKQSNAMEQLLLSNQRSAWQDIFIGIYPYKLADIYESRGIYLFYQDKIDEAIVEFEKITPFESQQYNWQKSEYETIIIDYKTQELLGNPFNGKIK
ncbi:MAG TPA: hypothetical protein VKY33_05495, partial [Flavobacterium sp.]|nr:hypothetical protein [Flavobacterium sp.]